MADPVADLMNPNTSAVALGTPDALDIPAEDQVYPLLQLMQGTSKGVANVDIGRFKINILEESWDQVDVVFFKLLFGRVLYSTEVGDPPVCGSDDRLTPSTRFSEPMSDRCVSCRYSNPRVTIDDQSCGTTITLLGSIAGDNENKYLPFVWRVGRTALRPVQQLITSMKYKIQKDQKFVHNFNIRLSTKKIEEPGKAYYVPQAQHTGYIVGDSTLDSMYLEMKDFDPTGDKSPLKEEPKATEGEPESVAGVPF